MNGECGDADLIEQEIGEKAVPFSVIEIFSSIRKKGLKKTFKDRNLAPHTHLLMLLLVTMGMAIAIQIIFLL